MIKVSKLLDNLLPSAMQRSLNIKERHISFALGMPATELLPIQEITKNTVLQSSLQYSPPKNELKQHIVSLMHNRGVKCNTQNIFLTSGAQQGIALLTKIIVEANSSVISPNLVYPGFIQVAQSLNTRILPVRSPSDHEIIDLEHLRFLLQEVDDKPSLIYMVADGNNPKGINLSLKDRRSLIKVSQKYNIPIIEDDAYGFLNYENNSLPSLKSIDQENVCYVGSFSKILAPTLRVGWLVVPDYLLPKLSVLKESYDINTSTFSQILLNQFMNNKLLSPHLQHIKKVYKAKRDLMHQCLEKHISNYAKWQIPDNGFFFWLNFYEKNMDVTELFNIALEHKISIVPGCDFEVKKNGEGNRSLRLNFSYPSYDEIESGIATLASVIKLYLKRNNCC